MTAAELERRRGLELTPGAAGVGLREHGRHIERKARGFRGLLHETSPKMPPVALLPVRMVVSAAHVTPEPPLPGEGRLARYTWHDGYTVLRERLDGLGAPGRQYRVSSTRQHVDREAAAGPVSASTARTR
jgi:hypothetical protein